LLLIQCLSVCRLACPPVGWTAGSADPAMRLPSVHLIGKLVLLCAAWSQASGASGQSGGGVLSASNVANGRRGRGRPSAPRNRSQVLAV
jgi:hypothetical protein